MSNVHDVTKADELRRPDDWEVIGDSGYLGMEKRDSADPERVNLYGRETLQSEKEALGRENCRRKAAEFDQMQGRTRLSSN